MWYRRPRKISVITDNNGWALPFSKTLVERLNAAGEDAQLVRTYDNVPEGVIAFYLGCLRITPAEVLARNLYNLVVHASDLPKGRGFSPLTWLVLEGRNDVPVCLIDAAAEVDSGDIYAKEWITFQGHELIDEMREILGTKTIELCLNFAMSPEPPVATPQSGEPTYFERRRPKDSEVDPDRSLRDLFNNFRVADNDDYPVFFRHKGCTYVLKIEKAEPSKS